MRAQLQHFVYICLTSYFGFSLIEAQIFGESTTTTLTLIKDYGYTSETHKVTTEDGYILTMYRIPFSPKDKTNSDQNKRPVIFIMHGLMESSSDWVLSGYPRGLAFYLSDAGYDVWLGNARGTRFSNEHTTLKTNEPVYWDFSWHEIGIYDLPAFLNYILKNTTNSKLQYIGHSQGTTSFFVATSSLNNFNDKIQSAHLMAPSAFMNYATSIILPPSALILGHPLPLTDTGFNFAPNSRIAQIASKIFCGKYSLVKYGCQLLSFTGSGFSTYSNSSALEIFYETQPAGASIKQAIHYLQLYNSGKFCQFDYGPIENSRIYKQTSPPDYQLQNIRAPLYLYYSKGDAYADPRNVQKLIEKLSNTILKKLYKMPFKTWNHGDFVYANNVDELLYSIILDDLKIGAEL